MWPHTRHLLRVKQDIHIVNYGRNLEGSDSRQNVIVGVVVVVIGNQLTVNIFLEPGLGNFVHDADRIGYGRLYRVSHLIEGRQVLGFVMPSVPRVRLAVPAHLENERDLL